MQLDFVARELTIKVVYYGPALSGKTTNLQALHRCADESARGRLMTLDTRDDRTLFFDLLPLTFRAGSDLSLRLKVFTVPGQVIHASTRRLVLQGADGVVFVADSQTGETQNNAAAFLELKENLKTHGRQLSRMPVVIQFNKRDLPNVRGEDEIAQLAARGREPVFCSVATKGTGVRETFLGVLKLTYTSLEAEHDLRGKFGLDADAFLAEVAARLGSSDPVDRLLATCMGGALEVLAQPGRPA